MEYTFSPLTDFPKLEEAIARLYGDAAPMQTKRFRGLLRGLEDRKSTRLNSSHIH